jgi:hypothetical protein
MSQALVRCVYLLLCLLTGLLASFVLRYFSLLYFMFIQFSNISVFCPVSLQYFPLPYSPKQFFFLNWSPEGLDHLTTTHKVEQVLYWHFPAQWRLLKGVILYLDNNSILVALAAILQLYHCIHIVIMKHTMPEESYSLCFQVFFMLSFLNQIFNTNATHLLISPLL